MKKEPSLQMQVIELLKLQLALANTRLDEARQDIEFYRGKVERLELAIMSNPPAQQEYVQTQIVHKPEIRDVKPPMTLKPRVPFSDLKQQWNAMSAEEQEKAMQDGWEVNKEATNAGQ